MSRSTFAICAVVASAVLALSACGDDNGAADPGTSGAASDGGASQLSGELAGGGSSAQASAQDAWRAAFQNANPGVSVNYDPVGSGAGRTGFEAGAYPFVGSDAFISDPGEYASAVKQCSADPIEVPDYISPIAVVFDLPGVSTLKLDAATIAKVFSGAVKTWNDPAIASQNPGVKLPSTTIHPVHRSDDSGTTQNFTDYLSKAAGSAWATPPSQTWPTADGLSGEGTSGVIAAVQGGKGTIGYADASQAGGLGVVSIKVGGRYVAPSAEGAAEVVSRSNQDASAKHGQLIYDINRTDVAPGSYPLLLVSYLIACPTYSDAGTAALVRSYLSYVVSQTGQYVGSQAAGSAPLTANVSAAAGEIVGAITDK